jgi:hypothetical protein
MTSEPVGNPIEHRILPQRYRPALCRHTVLRKTLITLAASAMLGVSAIAPNAALAFGPPPPPPGLGGLPPPGLGGLPHPGLGGPPHRGVGGPLPRAGAGGPLSHLRGSPGSQNVGRGFQRNLQGRFASNGYRRSAGSSYGRYGWRDRSYSVYVDGNYGSSNSYADDGCYYTYTSRRHRGAVVCSQD